MVGKNGGYNLGIYMIEWEIVLPKISKDARDFHLQKLTTNIHQYGISPACPLCTPTTMKDFEAQKRIQLYLVTLPSGKFT